MMQPVIVIGGGPAGIMAAITCAGQGVSVELWERNDRLGRKLAITGKGRCNLTNAAPSIEELIRNIPGNGQFLYGALSRFTVEDTMTFFTSRGLALKTERGRRVFPASDRAADVVALLQQTLLDMGVTIRYHFRGKKLHYRNGRVSGIYTLSGEFHPASAVIVATGGVSYPATGSTGDGYALAEQVGHTIIPPQPSLVPLETTETWPRQVSGLALRNVEISLWDEKKELEREFGEMLFTHFGVSGPVILSLSRAVCRHSDRQLRLQIDLKPALTHEQLDERLQRDFLKFSRRQFRNALGDLLPASLIPVFVELSHIPPEKACNQLTREERGIVLALLKGLPLHIQGTRPVAEAIVTAGGVSVREISPKTMASKLAKGLYFAGEVLDVDAYTGGYNLQAAWATGYVAGLSVADWCWSQEETTQ